MVTEVYGDLLFLINAGMDCLCFCLTARILHRKPGLPRLLIGAVLGGAYAVAALFLEAGNLPTLLIDLGACFLMCTVVFAGRKHGMRALLFDFGLYLIISTVLGGIMTALYNLLNRTGLSDVLAGEGGADGGTFLFAILVAVGGVATLWGGRRIRRAGAVRACRVTIEMDGRRVEIDGLIDSGNLLCDPIGGTPVIVVERSSLTSLLFHPLDGLLKENHIPDIPPDHPDAKRLRFIPTRTAAGDKLLAAVRPDRVLLTPEGAKPRQVQALIALSDLNTNREEGIPTSAMVPGELIQ